jgi:hypothetical protein
VLWPWVAWVQGTRGHFICDGLATSCGQFFQGQLDLGLYKLLGKEAREIWCIVLGVLTGCDR